MAPFFQSQSMCVWPPSPSPPKRLNTVSAWAAVMSWMFLGRSVPNGEDRAAVAGQFLDAAIAAHAAPLAPQK